MGTLENRDRIAELDIVIPVYNEGENIVSVLESLAASVRTPCKVLICYDRDSDNTLPALQRFTDKRISIRTVKNQGAGAHGAVLTGFRASTAPAVLVLPADDTFNAPILDSMAKMIREGYDLVAASRFIPGGCMEGCPWLKAAMVRVAAFTLYHLARVPTHDATSGFRMFSRRTVDQIQIESTEGFTYSIELLVKCHRLGWKVGEVPAKWYERQHGKSGFKPIKWAPAYWVWYAYAFATTYLRRSATTVPLASQLKQP